MGFLARPAPWRSCCSAPCAFQGLGDPGSVHGPPAVCRHVCVEDGGGGEFRVAIGGGEFSMVFSLPKGEWCGLGVSTGRCGGRWSKVNSPRLISGEIRA